MLVALTALSVVRQPEVPREIYARSVTLSTVFVISEAAHAHSKTRWLASILICDAWSEGWRAFVHYYVSESRSRYVRLAKGTGANHKVRGAVLATSSAHLIRTS